MQRNIGGLKMYRKPIRGLFGEADTRYSVFELVTRRFKAFSQPHDLHQDLYSNGLEASRLHIDSEEVEVWRVWMSVLCA